METGDLLQKYLEEILSNQNLKDIFLYMYSINDSIINMEYSYNPNYEWDKNYISYDNKIEIELLDYMTWIYNQTNK